MNRREKKEKPYVETIGKTEPVAGIHTEPLKGKTIDPYVYVPQTIPVNNGFENRGLIDIPNLDPDSPPDSYQGTVPVNIITTPTGEEILPVVGWLVCVEGPNMGKEFRIHSDYNYVGSNQGDLIIPGDPKISRQNHMAITYDPEERKFYISPGTGRNIIRLNKTALAANGYAELKNYDVIRTGDSAFMFIGLCGEHFGWDDLTAK